MFLTGTSSMGACYIKKNRRDFLEHEFNDSSCTYHRALGTCSLGNLYAISFCDSFVKGCEILSRM